MLVHPPDLSLPPEPKDPPREPNAAMILVLAVGLAVLWLILAVSITLMVGGIWFVSELIGERAPAERRSVILLGGITVSLVSYRLAWLLFDRPSGGTFLSSLIGGVAVLGLAIAARLAYGEISAGPDLLVPGFIALASGLGVWQTR